MREKSKSDSRNSVPKKRVRRESIKALNVDKIQRESNKPTEFEIKKFLLQSPNLGQNFKIMPRHTERADVCRIYLKPSNQVESDLSGSRRELISPNTASSPAKVEKYFDFPVESDSIEETEEFVIDKKSDFYSVWMTLDFIAMVVDCKIRSTLSALSHSESLFCSTLTLRPSFSLQTAG